MHSVCRCSLLVWRISFLKKGTPVNYCWPALDPPLGRSGRKTTTRVRDHEYFIPTKFHLNSSSGFGEEVENVKVYGRRTTTDDDGRRRTPTDADGRRRTTTDDDGRRRATTDADGWRTTDGRRTVRYDNSSLEPSAQVSLKRQQKFRLHNDCGPTVSRSNSSHPLVWLNGFYGRQPSHSPQQQCNQKDYDTTEKLFTIQTFIKMDILAKSNYKEHEILQYIMTIFKITSVWVCRNFL